MTFGNVPKRIDLQKVSRLDFQNQPANGIRRIVPVFKRSLQTKTRLFVVTKLEIQQILGISGLDELFERSGEGELVVRVVVHCQSVVHVKSDESATTNQEKTPSV